MRVTAIRNIGGACVSYLCPRGLRPALRRARDDASSPARAHPQRLGIRTRSWPLDPGPCTVRRSSAKWGARVRSAWIIARNQPRDGWSHAMTSFNVPPPEKYRRWSIDTMTFRLLSGPAHFGSTQIGLKRIMFSFSVFDIFIVKNHVNSNKKTSSDYKLLKNVDFCALWLFWQKGNRKKR